MIEINPISSAKQSQIIDRKAVQRDVEGVRRVLGE